MKQSISRHIRTHACPPRSLAVSARSYTSRFARVQAAIAQGATRRRLLALERPEVATAAAGSAEAAPAQDYRERKPGDVRIVVAGATGYIGKFVVKELIRRGYNVVALSRAHSGIGGKQSMDDVRKDFEGADARFGDVTSMESLRTSAFDAPVDVVISCLASRTGGIQDSWDIDYQATLNCLNAGREQGASHFVLLSAICVQKPLLEFQKAKLKFEAELQAADDITHSIVRPTAFFKSLAGQVDIVKGGGPYVMFGDGNLCACKPISERDLASFMADCVSQEDKINQVLPIGGPGEAVTPRQQAEMLFRLADVKPNLFPVPVALMDGVINLLDFLAKFFPNLKDSAEFGRIGKYYATESMLLWDEEAQRYLPDATPGYGNDTLEAFFKHAIEIGLEGQELGDQAVF